jgi:MFS family permease
MLPRTTHGPRPVRPVGLIAVVLAVMAVGVTTTALGVVARSVADDLDVGAAGLGWAVNAYLLVAASLALVGGRLGDRFGRRRTFGVGCAVFAVGSGVAALAPGIGVLITARVLQGMGAALLLPASIEVIAAVRHGADESRALLIRGTAFAVAFGIGPLVGGLLGDTVGWRWLFVLVAVLALASALAVLADRSPVEPDGEPLHDPMGALLSVVGVFAVVLLAERGRIWGASGTSIAAVVLGLAVLALFVVLERRSPAPLLHPSLLRDRVVLGGDLATFASSLGMLGLLYFFGIFARSAAVFDASAAQVAFALVPFTLSLALLGRVAGRLVKRFGRAVPVVVGMGLMAAGFFVLSLTTVDSTDVDLLLPLAICGIGAGLANACVTGPAVLSVDQLRLGEAAGVASLARFAGTALAVAIGTATYLNVGAHHVSPITTSTDAPAAEVAAGTGGAVPADELVIGGDAFERALNALDHDLQAPFRDAVRLDAVDGFTATMRWTGFTIAGAAIASGWLLRAERQPRQSSSGVRSRGPANGSGTGPPEPADA